MRGSEDSARDIDIPKLVTSNTLRVLSVEMVQHSSPPGLACRSTIASTGQRVQVKRYKSKGTDHRVQVTRYRVHAEVIGHE